MKRTGKIGLLMAALVILIVAAVVALKSGSENTTNTQETESITIFSLDDAQVTKLSWTYLDNTMEFSYTDDAWSYSENSEFPVDDTPLDQMLNAITEIAATKTIENTEALTEYGLDKPSCTVVVTTDQEYTLFFGNRNTMGGSVYMSLGDGNVYLVEEGILDYFSYGLYDLVDKESIPSMNDIVSFIVEADTRTLEIEYLEDSGLAYSDSYTWFLKEDNTYTTLDTELVESFTYYITNMSWGDCVEFGIDEDGLNFYGLDKPSTTITVRYIKTTQQETNEVDEDGNAVYETVETEEFFVLEIGSEMDDSYYARIADSNMVYLIDSSIVDAMRYTTAEELLPDEILLLDEDSIESVEVTLDGEHYTVTREIREVEVVSEDSTAEPETTEEIIYLMQETEVDFLTIVDQILSMESSGSISGEVDAKTEEISFLFHMDNQEYPELTLTFYQYNSTDCIVSLNGETRLLAARDTVVALAETFRTLTLD